MYLKNKFQVKYEEEQLKVIQLKEQLEDLIIELNTTKDLIDTNDKKHEMDLNEILKENEELRVQLNNANDKTNQTNQIQKMVDEFETKYKQLEELNNDDSKITEMEIENNNLKQNYNMLKEKYQSRLEFVEVENIRLKELEINYKQLEHDYQNIVVINEGLQNDKKKIVNETNELRKLTRTLRPTIVSKEEELPIVPIYVKKAVKSTKRGL
jgi:chromosome segregation ATPase